MNRVKVVDRTLKDAVSPFPCCPANRECLGKKMQIEKKCTLRELRHRGFLGILVVEYICYIFLTVREAAFAENYAFCGVTYSEM